MSASTHSALGPGAAQMPSHERITVDANRGSAGCGPTAWRIFAT